MYTLIINGTECGTANTVKEIKERFAKKAPKNGDVYAVIKKGSQTYAIFDNNHWERYISETEQQIEDCRLAYLRSNFSRFAKWRIRRRYGNEIFERAMKRIVKVA